MQENDDVGAAQVAAENQEVLTVQAVLDSVEQVTSALSRTADAAYVLCRVTAVILAAVGVIGMVVFLASQELSRAFQMLTVGLLSALFFFALGIIVSQLASIAYHGRVAAALFAWKCGREEKSG